MWTDETKVKLFGLMFAEKQAVCQQEHDIPTLKHNAGGDMV